MELRKTNFNGTPCWLYRLHFNVSAGPPGGGACPYVVNYYPKRRPLSQTVLSSADWLSRGACWQILPLDTRGVPAWPVTVLFEFPMIQSIGIEILPALLR